MGWRYHMIVMMAPSKTEKVAPSQGVTTTQLARPLEPRTQDSSETSDLTHRPTATDRDRDRVDEGSEGGEMGARRACRKRDRAVRD